jgi:acylglycerol lipase
MHTINSTLQTPDGLKLHTVEWRPETEPKAAVMIVHGVAEHSGRYAHVAAFLNGRGYAVYSLDYRGHGQSEGERSYFQDCEEPIGDLGQYLDQVRAAQPGKALFMMGHSLGALLGLGFVLDNQETLDGLIFSGVPLSMADTAPALVAFSRFLNRIAPKTPMLKLKSDNICRDDAIRSAYDTDPLNYRGPMRVRPLLSMVYLSREILNGLKRIRLPVLIMHGGADRIVAPGGSETVYRQIGSPDKTLKIYPGLFHEILNEPEQNTVLTDIADWLDARVPHHLSARAN